MLQILKLYPEAKLPERKTSGSAGYDLYSLTSGVIEIHGRLLIPTGIAIKLPIGTVVLIKSRSGLSVRSGIEHGAGVIDSDYFPGHVQILLYNHSDESFEFEKHTRVAQLLIVPILTPEIEEVTTMDDKKNSRDGKGFGSTGLMD